MQQTVGDINALANAHTTLIGIVVFIVASALVFWRQLYFASKGTKERLVYFMLWGLRIVIVGTLIQATDSALIRTAYVAVLAVCFVAEQLDVKRIRITS
ncbi:hypothetical protein H7Y40_02920 [Pedobacter sp.]|nr:hypothetical protein [Candidatus Saccharibacteria bacterium]